MQADNSFNISGEVSADIFKSVPKIQPKTSRFGGVKVVLEGKVVKVDKKSAQAYLRSLTGQEVTKDKEIKTMFAEIAGYKEIIHFMTQGDLNVEGLTDKKIDQFRIFLEKNASIRFNFKEALKNKPLSLYGHIDQRKAVTLKKLFNFLEISHLNTDKCHFEGEIPRSLFTGEFKITPESAKEFRVFVNFVSGVEPEERKKIFGGSSFTAKVVMNNKSDTSEVLIDEKVRGKMHSLQASLNEIDKIKDLADENFVKANNEELMTRISKGPKKHNARIVFEEPKNGYPDKKWDRKEGSVAGIFRSGEFESTGLGIVDAGFAALRGGKTQGVSEDRAFMGQLTVAGRHLVYGGVADGHGGDYVSSLISDNIKVSLEKTFKNLSEKELQQTDKVRSALESAVEDLHRVYAAQDQKFVPKRVGGTMQRPISAIGSTINFCVIVGSKTYNVNLGDSRAVGIQSERAIALSRDQDYPNIEKDISSRGGEVIGGRLVCISPEFVKYYSQGIGALAAIGDSVAEPMIRRPDITVCDTPELIAIGCDGLFDAWSSRDVAKEVKSRAEKTDNAAEIAQSLAEKGFKEHYSGDDITVVVFKPEISSSQSNSRT